jgi:hypothetical protein
LPQQGSHTFGRGHAWACSATPAGNASVRGRISEPNRVATHERCDSRSSRAIHVELYRYRASCRPQSEPAAERPRGNSATSRKQLDVVRHRNGEDFAPVKRWGRRPQPPTGRGPAGHRHHRRRERHSGFRHGSRAIGSALLEITLPVTLQVRGDAAPGGHHPSPCCASLPGNAVPLLLERVGRCLRDQKRLSACRRWPIRPMRKTLTRATTPWLHPHPTRGRVQRTSDSPAPKRNGSRGCDLAPYTRGATRLGLGPTSVEALRKRA